VNIAQSTYKTGSDRNPMKSAVPGRNKSNTSGKVPPAQNSDTQNRSRNQPIGLPDLVRAFLGSERDAVIRVQSLLVCIGQAMESNHPARGPYYPDVIAIASDILRQRVVNMDELLLSGLIPEETNRSDGSVGVTD
jgi:hypothetical protein